METTTNSVFFKPIPQVHANPERIKRSSSAKELIGNAPLTVASCADCVSASFACYVWASLRPVPCRCHCYCRQLSGLTCKNCSSIRASAAEASAHSLGSATLVAPCHCQNTPGPVSTAGDEEGDAKGRLISVK